VHIGSSIAHTTTNLWHNNNDLGDARTDIVVVELDQLRIGVVVSQIVPYESHPESQQEPR
jgi:hypothetical protein